MKPYVLALLSVLFGPPQPLMAQDYDMDCKVILCMPAGFPQGCADAASYAFKRMRKGKPPFGTCSSPTGDFNPTISTHASSRYYCEPGTYLVTRQSGNGNSTTNQCATGYHIETTQGDKTVIYEGLTDPTLLEYSFVFELEEGKPQYFTGNYSGFYLNSDEPYVPETFSIPGITDQPVEKN